MRIPFRQGIVQYKHPLFVQVNFPFVDLVASIDSPLILNIASSTSDYLQVEKDNITNAWGPIVANADVWLYIDLDRHTAVRTFGTTYVLPTFGATIPTTPQLDQHWFDTAVNEMKVWNGTSWVVKTRIFACMLQSGVIPVSMSINSPASFDGTQIGNTNSVLSGYILFDADNNPMRSIDGQFTTSETIIRVNSSTANDVKVASMVVEAVALVNFPAFTIVEFAGFGKVQPASAFVTQIKKQYGIVQQDAHTGDIVNVGVDGVFTNLDWDWTSAGVNAYLYNDSNGVISATPSIPEQQPVAIVVDTHTIMLVTKVIVTNLPPTLAGNTNFGTVTLSVPAVDTAKPIAVGDNDPRLTNARTPLAHVHPISDVTNLQSLLDAKVTLTGGTMSGNLILNADPSTALGAATKQYVDNALLGLFWQAPILDPDLKDDSLNTPPLSPGEETYIVGPTPTGAWIGLAGHVVRWDIASWVDVLGRPVAAGDRFGIGMEYGGIPGGGLTGYIKYVAEVVTNVPGSITYTFTAPSQGNAVLVNASGSSHFGHQYTYNGSNWVELSGHISLDQLTDVTLTTPAAGQALTFNGTNWINSTPASSMATLTDVTLLSPTAGQTLTFNGTTWVNSDSSSGLPSMVGHRKALLTNDGTTANWTNVLDLTNETTLSSIPSSLLGAATLTSSTTPTSGTNDDGYWALTVPFSISFLGATYTSIAVGTNSYITFGAGYTAYSGLSASNPAAPKIFMNASDRSCQRIYYGTTGVSPNRTFRIRFEGHIAFNGGVLGSPTLVWETTFYENNPTQIDLQFGNMGDLTGISGIYSATTLNMAVPTVQTTGYRYIIAPAVTINGVIGIANGGTGATTASNAFNALVPSQSGNTGKYLTTNGTTTSWGAVAGGGASYPSSGGVANKVLISTDGGGTAWIPISNIPILSYKLFECGSNAVGQLGDGTNIIRSRPVQVGALSDWMTLSQGDNSAAAIKHDGTLWTWGYNNTGQLGDGTTVSKSSPIQVGSLTNWSSVDFGRFHFTAVKTDGTLWACGFNGYGQLGDGTLLVKSSPIQVGTLTNWNQSASGQEYTAAIKTDGTLWMCGYNNYGQLGDGTRTTKSIMVQIGSLTNWKQVSCGSRHSMAVKTDGTLWAWGVNFAGQLGDGTTSHKSSPVQIGSLNNWKQVFCGYAHTTMLKTDGTLWACGYNNHGQLGDGTTVTKSSPIQIGNLATWAQASCGKAHTAAIKTDGTLWTCGYNDQGQLAEGDAGQYSSLIQVGSQTHWIQVSCKSSNTGVLAGNLTATNVSNGGTGLTSVGNRLQVLRTNPTATALEWSDTGSASYPSSGGVANKVLISADGVNTAWIPISNVPPLSYKLFGCGSNSYGQIGDGTSVNKNSPTQVGTLLDWMDISAGGYWTSAVKSDGTLWTWGRNTYGELGDGTTISRSSPTQIGADTSWSSVNVGIAHSLATKIDGTLWAWGDNSSGQLGDETVAPKSSPIQVGSLTDWNQVAGGNGFTTAVKTDGTLWAWGYNGFGQLGIGTSIDAFSPIQVGSLTNWKQVSCGGESTAAIKLDGTLWTWGYNGRGQLGTGTTNQENSPVQVGTGSNWIQVSMGGETMFAIKSDHTMWACGYNSFGQLGDGTTVHKSSLVQIGSGSTWTYVDTGFFHTLAIKTDGTVWACGYNSNGQLGDGTNTTKSSLVQVGTLNYWKKAVAGHYSTAMIANDSSTVTSIGVSGGTTGLTTIGSPVTSSGTITIAGTLNVSNGGTGLTSLGTSLQALRTNATATAMEWGSVGTVTSITGSGGTTGLTLTGGPITTAGTLTLGGTLGFANGGTGLTVVGNGLQVLRTNATMTALEWATSGTVTSVALSGGTTGLTFNGGPITSSGTITLAGTLGFANGGTGQTTANTALNAMLPTQTGNAGNVLTTNGTNTSWTPPAGRISNVAYSPIVSLNWTNLDIIRITLTGNITITNQLAAFDGQRAILELTQDGIGNRTVLFTSETIFGSDIVYTPSTLPNKTDVLGISYHQPTGKFRIVAVARGY